MEDDIVLADKVYQLGFLRLPPFLPTLRKQFLSVGDVTDRRVEPHVEHLSFSSFYRHRNAPIQVTAHCTRQEVGIQPGLALSVDIGLPLLVLLENPLAEPRFILIQRQIPMLGHHLHRLAAAKRGLRVDQLFRAERAAAFLALVAIGIRIAAFRASACDIAVCKESLGFRIEELFRLLGDEFIFIVKFTEELGCVFFVDLG